MTIQICPIRRLYQILADYCCCDAGKSQSPAMAAAAMRYLGMDDMAVWRNPHCHPNMLANTLGAEVSDEEKDFRFYTNQNAFRDAMRK